MTPTATSRHLSKPAHIGPRAALAALVALATLAAAPAYARTFVLDGDVAEWTDADRIDAEPGFEVGDYALYGYHDAAAGKYHLAIVAPVAIGPNTTIWLNTDRDTTTGYQVWGALVGAEYNINFDSAGLPHLYTGADAEQWQLGPLSHAASDDRRVLELEWTSGMIGVATPIDVWLDINNQVFLPSWFGGGGYKVDAVGVPTPPPAPTGGAITLDGALDEWTLRDRIDRLPGMASLGYEIYGRADETTYYLALRALPPADAIGPATTFWLNTDRDRSTGHQVWGIAVGAELNINIAWDGTPHLYSGAAAENWIVGPLPHGRSADGTVIEIALDRGLMAPSARSIDVSIDVNDLTFLPADFTGAGHTLYHPEQLPPVAEDRPLRVGIVHSQTTSNAFFGDKAYGQLYAAMQHQAMVAGIPYVLLREDDLLDIHKVKDLSAIFVPYFANVEPSKVDAIADVLARAVYHYGIGIVSAGNLLTNAPDGSALPGDSYLRMKRLLGLTLAGYFGPLDHTLSVTSGHRMLEGYAEGEQLQSYAAGYMLHFRRHDAVADAVAVVTTPSAKLPAVWTTTTGARHVHFASPSIIGDTDLAARALLWSIYGDGVAVGVHPTREGSVFIGRCDMDQSQYVDEAPIVYGALLPIVEQWRAAFGFVSSYYVNIGNKPKSGETTDWSYSGGVYKQLMALGNEIGTHSYTHPHFTSELSTSQLLFEFKTSRDVLAEKLGVPIVGAAVPGNPEPLSVDVFLNDYFTYATADFSGTGAGYHGAMGRLSPDFDMVYLAPNMYFDFTMMDFLQYSPDKALATWKQQFDDLVDHAPGAFVVWPWHDYGPTSYEGPQYQLYVFTELLAHAYAKGTEFVTAATAAMRVNAFAATEVRSADLGDGRIEVDVRGDEALEAFALRLELPNGHVIQYVDDWPAFDDRDVFLAAGDRIYTVHTGTAAASGTHISRLPPGATLNDAYTTSTGLRFRFNGAGTVEISVGADVTAVETSCSDAALSLVGSTASLTFAKAGEHTCELAIASASN